jgi:hypothetical protein
MLFLGVLDEVDSEERERVVAESNLYSYLDR